MKKILFLVAVLFLGGMFFNSQVQISSGQSTTVAPIEYQDTLCISSASQCPSGFTTGTDPSCAGIYCTCDQNSACHTSYINSQQGNCFDAGGTCKSGISCAGEIDHTRNESCAISGDVCCVESTVTRNDTPNRCEAGETSSCVSTGTTADIIDESHIATARTACSAKTTSSITYSLVEPVSSDDTCPNGQLLCCGKTSTSTATGTDYCTGGDCSLSTCTTERPFITAGSCGDATKKCCQSARTTGVGSGVVVNSGCSGDCLENCTVVGRARSSNVSEYCETAGFECCAPMGGATTTVGNGTAPTTNNSGTGCEPNFTKENGVCFPTTTGLSEKPVKDILVAVLAWLLGVFGVLGILVFVVSGIFYFTAAGDADTEKKAKNAMMMGIMGVVVGLAGFVIIQAIDMALNARSGF